MQPGQLYTWGRGSDGQLLDGTWSRNLQELPIGGFCSIFGDECLLQETKARDIPCTREFVQHSQMNGASKALESMFLAEHARNCLPSCFASALGRETCKVGSPFQGGPLLDLLGLAHEDVAFNAVNPKTRIVRTGILQGLGLRVCFERSIGSYQKSFLSNGVRPFLMLKALVVGC